MINNFNILADAFRTIPHITVQYKKYTGKSINDFGRTIQTFADAKSISAIVQPGIVSSFGGKCIELKDYKEMGLDWARRYITIWMFGCGIEPAASKEGADIVIYNGMEFTVIQVENWEQYTGYQRCYCVEKK